MTVLVSGYAGMIGAALVGELRRSGHGVIGLSRAAREGCLRWDPLAERFLDAFPEGVDAIVNLAGEPILGRWTASKRKAIRQSRVAATRCLVNAVKRASTRPFVFVSASAIGYYGFERATPVDESSPVGDGFLAEVCRDWEAELDGLSEVGVRSVALRIGVVLGAAGGALGQLLPIFRAGLGGPVGDGNRWMSWIGLGELVRVIEFCIGTESVRGPVNAVCPEPVTNRAFTGVLAGVLGRPAAIPVPPFALRLVWGRQMADETLLSSVRVVPKHLLESGYVFARPDLKSALEGELER